MDAITRRNSANWCLPSGKSALLSDSWAFFGGARDFDDEASGRERFNSWISSSLPCKRA